MTGFAARPLAELLSEQPERPDWRWHGYAAGGAVTVLYGAPKAGKSTLLFALLKAMQDGASLLDHTTSSKGALLLSEERPASLREKVAGFGLTATHAHALMRHEARGEWAEIVRDAVTYCRQQAIDVLAVDTLAAWSGLRGDAENSAGAVQEVMAPLSAAASTGLAVVVLAHARKGNGTTTAVGEGLRGSSALAGAVDILVEVEQRGSDDGAHGLRLRASGRFADVPDQVVATYDDDEHRYSVSGSSPRAAKKAEQAREVAEWVAGHPGSTLGDVEVGMGIARGTASRRLAAAAEAGLLVRIGFGGKSDPHRWDVADTAPDLCPSTPFLGGGVWTDETRSPREFGPSTIQGQGASEVDESPHSSSLARSELPSMYRDGVA